jgi:predicted small integral membrane protein
MHVPLAFAMGPAAFFGVVALLLAAMAVRVAQEPVSEGAGSARRRESVLIFGAILAGIVCFVCVVLGCAAIGAVHAFDHSGADFRNY